MAVDSYKQLKNVGFYLLSPPDALSATFTYKGKNSCELQLSVFIT